MNADSPFRRATIPCHKYTIYMIACIGILFLALIRKKTEAINIMDKKIYNPSHTFTIILLSKSYMICVSLVLTYVNIKFTDLFSSNFEIWN